MTRAADWYPWLRYALLFISLVAAVAIAVPPKLISRRGVAVAALAGVLALGGGSAAYAADTAATPHAGSIPSAGPSSNTASGVSGLGGGRSSFSQQGNGSELQSGQGEIPGGSGPGAPTSSNTELAALLEASSTPAGPRQPSATKVRPASNWPVAARPSSLLVAGVDPIRRRHSRNSRRMSPAERSVTSLSAERAAARAAAPEPAARSPTG